MLKPALSLLAELAHIGHETGRRLPPSGLDDSLAWSIFTDILTKVTLPIMALVAMGWVLQPRLKLDVGTLNRLQVNVILPSFFLFTLSTSKQPLSAIWPTALFMLIQLLFLIPLGWLLAIVFRMKPETGPVVGLGMAYANVGFFGVPVTLLDRKSVV